MKRSPSVGEEYESREQFEADRVGGVFDGSLQELYRFVIECQVWSEWVRWVAIVVVELERGDSASVVEGRHGRIGVEGVVRV